MEVNEELVRKIAKISRLNLSDEEIKTFTPELGEVLKAFSELSNVDTEGVEPIFNPLDLTDTVREDHVGECLSQEEALSLTSHKKDGFFKGPKAIDK